MNDIETHIELQGETYFAGTLYTHLRRGREGSSFRYDAEYLTNLHAYAFEPAMPLALGDFPFTQGLPRSFRDASPDRWGRLLIEKGLRHRWHIEAEPPRTITETDYLLSTNDFTRQGALRFRTKEDIAFRAVGEHVPQLISLPKLLSASNKLCRGDLEESESYDAVKILLDAGTGSLGGARPKTSVLDSDSRGGNTLYLAKFPHPADAWDVMRWEKIALDLAEYAGVVVPERRLLPIGGTNVLVLRRFDRSEKNERIGYMSAMTLLESEEGQSRDYLDLADALSEISGSTSDDLTELWRRILFSLAINNTDDHLRNHAMLRTANVWRLSPAFDLNPVPDLKSGRVTAIGGAIFFEDGWKAAFEMREWFGINDDKAARITSALLDAMSQWEAIARKNGAQIEELRRFAPIFMRAIAALKNLPIDRR